MSVQNIGARLVSAFIVGVSRLLTGVRPAWQGCLPDDRQRIYFANHGSHGDFVLIWTVLPPPLRRSTRPVAGMDYWDKPGLRRFIARNVFNAVLIARRPQDGTQHPIEILSDALEEDCSLILFPEGTRNTSDEQLLAFKSGLARLARRHPDVECVPTWIENISRVLPKGELLPIPVLCTVTFGTPLHIAPDEAAEDFLERARNALLALRPLERD